MDQATISEETKIWEEARTRGLPAEGWLLIVDVASQQVAAWHQGLRQGRYAVSTARNGLGSREGSEGTPAGWHEIADRIGGGSPPGQVFLSRHPTDEVIPPSGWADDTAGDRILTRILRLRGLEPGLNAGAGIDTWERLIYVHGTAQEHRLGTPSSHGCIRMGNRDLLKLFKRLGTSPAWCWIGPRTPSAS